MFLNLHPLQILVPCIAGSASGGTPQSWWRGEKNPSINLVPRALQSLALFSAPPPKPGKSALGTRLSINIFQKVTIRKTRFANIFEKSALEKLGFFFTSCFLETTAGGILLTQYVALYSFYTNLVPRVLSLGNEVVFTTGCPCVFQTIKKQ